MNAAKPEWLPRVMEALPIAVVALDSTGHVIAANERAVELFSLDGDAILPGLPQEIQDAIARVLSGGDDPLQGETLLAGMPASYSVSPVDSEQGFPAVMLSIQPLELADTTKDLLLTAAHQLKTPLTAIKGGTQLLQRRVVRDQTQISGRDAELLGLVVGQVDRLTEMVESLLEASRLNSGRIQLSMSACRLDEVLQEAVALFEKKYTSPAIRLDLSSQTARVQCDQPRILQVVHALLLNAAAYSETTQPVIVTLIFRGETPCVAVSDTGPGVPEPDRPYIFECFYQGRNAKGGLGLGLYIASELVKLHGGRLWLESSPDQSSTFLFTLSLA